MRSKLQAASLCTLFFWSWNAGAQQPTPPNEEAPTTEESTEKEADPAGEEAAPAAAEELEPPVLKQDAQPDYPKRAEKERIAAVVIVTIDIDAAGHVENALVSQPSGSEGYGFEAAALAAAKKLLFEPARVGDQPVPVRITYRFRFEPKATPPPPPPQEVKKAPPPPQGELQGRLVERGTRLPIVGVKVTVFRGEGDEAIGFETETDENGEFVFQGLPVGEWRVLAEPEGYYPVRQTEVVQKDKRAEIKYRVERQSYNPYDVTVEADRIQREVNHTSIDAKRAERIPGTFGDVLAVVQNFPGVARSPGGQLVVRGSAPEDSKILVDKIEMPLLYHFGGLRGVMPVGMVERIDFYPGNYSVEFGRATGGIVDVDLKHLEPKKVGGYGDFNLFDTSLYLEAPITDDLSIAVAGRRSYIDALLSATLPDSGDQIVAPRYWDAHALASYRPSPAHHVEGFFMMSGDKFEVVFEEPQISDNTTVVSDIGYHVDFYRGVGQYHFIPNEKFSNELKISFGRDEIGFNQGEDIVVDSAQYQGQVRNVARFVASDWFAVRGGVDYLWVNYDYSLRMPELQFEGDFNEQAGGDFIGTDEEFVFSEALGNNHSTAGFVELEVNPYKSLLFVPGVRIDHFSRTEELAVSPRFTARQKLGDQWALKGGIGLFVQEPQVQETDEEFGNPDLGLERAVHYSAGVEYVPYDHLNIEVTGFYKTMHNLVTQAAQDDPLAGQDLNNGGQGRVYGLEVSAKHELANNFYGWLAYTLSRAERKDDGDDEYRLFDFDQTHILTLIGSYQLPKNWEISSRFRFVSGNVYTPVDAAVYDVDQGTYDPIPGATNSGRLQAFRQLDFRIDKRWIYKNWILGAYLDIQNVTNQQHQEGLSYNDDYTETESNSGLPILPILGLRGEF